MEPTSRFDLDQAIAAWRKDLTARPGVEAAAVRELEAHLRDSFAELQKAKLTDAEAFLIAKNRLGPPRAVASEFAKVVPPPFWRSRLLWATFLLVFGSFAAYAFLATPIYEATATLMPATRPVTDSSFMDPTEFNTYIRLMETRDLAIRAASEMSEQEREAFLAPYNIKYGRDSWNALVDRLLQQRLITPGRLAYMLNVNIEHPNPQIAVAVANHFAESFNELQRSRLQELKAQNPGKNVLFAAEFSLMNDAHRNVIQVSPKIMLLLVGGFFVALLSALAATLLARVLWYFRHRAPPAAQVS